MKKKSVVSVAFATAAACLTLADISRAAVYTETGDAGDLPATAQIIVGDINTFTSILGSTTPANGLYDSDMFQFTVVATESLTFTTNTAFIPGRNNFDTQLAVFNSAGVGLFANDDANAGSQLSTLTLTLSPGNYFLQLSGSGRYGVDSTGGLIFPNFTDGTTDPSATVPARTLLPITSYTGNTNEGGAYTINVSFAPVPEPRSYAFFLVGFAGLGWVLRSRKGSAQDLRPGQV